MKVGKQGERLKQGKEFTLAASLYFIISLHSWAFRSLDSLDIKSQGHCGSGLSEKRMESPIGDLNRNLDFFCQTCLF